MSILAEYTMIYTEDDDDEENGRILYEIIGHPILLSDVLAHLLKMASIKDLTVPSAIFTKEFNDVLELWDMVKPTYDEQSEECKMFIRNLVETTPSKTK